VRTDDQSFALDVVKIHYAGFLEDGSEFEDTREKEPLEFQVGSGRVVPGIETAVSCSILHLRATLRAVATRLILQPDGISPASPATLPFTAARRLLQTRARRVLRMNVTGRIVCAAHRF